MQKKKKNSLWTPWLFLVDTISDIINRLARPVNKRKQTLILRFHHCTAFFPLELTEWLDFRKKALHFVDTISQASVKMSAR